MSWLPMNAAIDGGCSRVWKSSQQLSKHKGAAQAVATLLSGPPALEGTLLKVT